MTSRSWPSSPAPPRTAGASRPSGSTGSRPPAIAGRPRRRRCSNPSRSQTASAYDASEPGDSALRYPVDADGSGGPSATLQPGRRPGARRAGRCGDDAVRVERIAYNAKGQRLLVAYGNGLMTRYAYDARTSRLARLRTERFTSPAPLTYRPNGDAAPGLRLRLRPGRQPPRPPRPQPGSGVPPTDAGPDGPGTPVRRARQLRALVDIRHRRVRTGRRQTPGSSGRSPTTRSTASCPRPAGSATRRRRRRRGPTRRAAATRPGRRPTPRPTGTTRSATCSSSGTCDAGTGFTADARARAGQQPAGDRDGRHGRLRATPTTRPATCSRRATARLFEWDHANRMRASHADPRVRLPTRRGPLERAVGPRPVPLRRGRAAGEEAGPQAGRHGRGRDLDRRRLRASAAPVRAGAVAENRTLHVMDGTKRIALVRIGAALPDDVRPAAHLRPGRPPRQQQRRRRRDRRLDQPRGVHALRRDQLRQLRPEALPLHRQGARRGERPVLPRGAVLRAVAGAVDEL